MAFRFTVRPLPDDDNPAWVRIPKTGRVKLKKKQGAALKIKHEKTTVSLKVHQGMREDANKMLVRIAPSAMQKLGVKEGDIIEISGQRDRASEICLIAIDCSISMGDNGKIDKVKNALDGFLDAKDKIKEDNDLVGFVGFAESAWLISEPSKGYRTAKKSFTAIKLKYGTNLAEPLKLCRNMILGKKGSKKVLPDKKDFRKHIILIGDGNSSVDPTTEAELCAKNGITVDTIGLIDPGNKAHQLTNLRNIAKIANGKYIPIDQANLNELLRRLSRAAKEKKLL